MQFQPHNDSYQIPFEPSPQASRASSALWLSAIVASAFYFGANVITAPEGARDGAEQAGQIFGKLLGTFLLPMIFVGVASAWRNNRTQRKGTTVAMLYEGQSKMLSESGRAIEEAELAKAAKAITLSVK
jgi:hypothetical protein